MKSHGQRTQTVERRRKLAGTFREKPGTPIRFVLLLSVALVVPAGCTAAPAPSDEVRQISTYPALEMGLYDGDVTYAQLAQMGNFGIGTFDGMDGEMMALDGLFYQARTDGSVRLAGHSLETPFRH
jgi:acetolactate decarboxylase